MSLESDLFEKRRPDEEKLISFGFQKQDDRWIYQRDLGKDGMQAQVSVSSSGKVTGRVMDTLSDEEYIAVHLEGQQGAYTASIRKLYLQVLEEIARNCFHPVLFASDQANRMDAWIHDHWHETGDHPFEKYPDYVSYRYPGNRKWYALVMNVTGEKIGMPSGNYEIVNLKSDHMDQLTDMDGILPAWHMNHTQWISVILNDTVGDEKLMELVSQSRDLIIAKNSSQKEIHQWLIPANPKYYDLDHGFSVSPQLYWSQSSHVHVGDLVYIYYGMPFGSIRYKCVVTETDIPDPQRSAEKGSPKLDMRIRKLYMYEDGQLDRKLLASYGVRAVRGPRSMPEDLIAEIRRRYPDDMKEE